MRLDTALRVLVVAACVWLAVACVDDFEINELLEEGWFHEEIIELMSEAQEESRVYKCYQPEEGVVYDHPSRRLAAKRASKVIEEHSALFLRQPNWWKHGVTIIRDEDGQETEQIGVVVWVSTKVPDSELPEDDRIPDCIGDVPVEIREEPEVVIEKLAGRQSPRHRAIMAGYGLPLPGRPLLPVGEPLARARRRLPVAYTPYGTYDLHTMSDTRYPS